jgi:hypothetical protein
MKKVSIGKILISSILLIPLNNLWLVYMQEVTSRGFPTTMSLFFNAVFTLLVLVFLNKVLLAKLTPRWKFSQGELLIIYSMVSIGSCLGAWDMYAVLISCLTHPFQFATPENKWSSLFFDYLPKWLMLSDRAVLEKYYQGWSSFYTKDVLLAWLSPILWWTVFFLLLLFVMSCINVIFRKQWIENEKLSFPIIQLPLAISDESFDFFKNKWMWAGFSISAFIDIINNINANFPFFPHIPIRDYELNQFVQNNPWRAIGWTPLYFFPCIIGLGYLLPLDLSFSCWFFYWYWKLQRVFSQAFNLGSVRPDMPYINDQASGAYIGIAFFVIWIARKYLFQVFKRALGKTSDVSDLDEPLRYRSALLGLCFGFFLLFLFLLKAGCSIVSATFFLLIYLALSLSIARMRAELGAPVHDLHYAGPDQMLTRLAGVENFSKGDLVFFTLSWGFNRAYRAHPMPHQIEGLKLAERTDTNYRQYLYAMLLAGFIGSLSAFWAHLYVRYKLGAASAKISPWVVGFGWEAYNRLSSWLNMPQSRDILCFVFTSFGFIGVIFLMLMKNFYIWWPFHPVAYAISASWSMGLMWFPLFISWLIKFFVLKSSGLKGYRKTLPFFQGLILGEFVIASITNILGIFFKWQIYFFWG